MDTTGPCASDRGDDERYRADRPGGVYCKSPSNGEDSQCRGYQAEESYGRQYWSSRYSHNCPAHDTAQRDEPQHDVDDRNATVGRTFPDKARKTYFIREVREGLYHEGCTIVPVRPEQVVGDGSTSTRRLYRDPPGCSTTHVMGS